MGPKEIAENILKKVDDFRISLQAETLARAYLELEKELKAHNEYQKWGPTKVLILEVEITKLKEELERLRIQRNDLLVDEYGVKKAYHYELEAELDKELERLRND